MKKLTKILFVAGGSLLLTGGAITNYLAAQPETLQEELTLANLEAMAIDPDELDKGPGGVVDLSDCEHKTMQTCYVRARLADGSYRSVPVANAKLTGTK